MSTRTQPEIARTIANRPEEPLVAASTPDVLRRTSPGGIGAARVLHPGLRRSDPIDDDLMLRVVAEVVGMDPSSSGLQSRLNP